MRAAERALKKAKVYKPSGKGAQSGAGYVARMHRVLGKPGMSELAAGRATAVKVGPRAKQYPLPSARGRVIVANEPGKKAYARKGEVFIADVTPSGRVDPFGTRRRLGPREALGAAPPVAMPRHGRGSEEGWVVAVNGHPSTVMFASYEAAQAHARRFYRRAMQAARRYPDDIVVSIDGMRRDTWDRVMEERDRRIADRRRAERQRLRALRRGIRPFR